MVANEGQDLLASLEGLATKVKNEIEDALSSGVLCGATSQRLCLR
jgi:hypothetical protein